jgi:hypothetical protein
MDQDQRVVEKFNASRAANTLMTVLAAAYAWQLHGVLIGVGMLVFLWVVRRWTANAITWRYIEKAVERDEDPDLARLLRLTMASRWACVIFAFAVLAANAAQVCTGEHCESIWS